MGIFLALVLVMGTAMHAAAQDASLSVPPTPQVEATPMVATAAHDIPRGVVLEAGDIVLEPVGDMARGATTAVTAGWITRRVIREGEALRAPAVSPPAAVQAGQPVQVVWSRGELEVTVRGTALRDAALGETVSVRVDTRRHLEGIAAGPGLVRIDTQPTRGS